MSAELRMITAGESHGPGLTCIVEGLPAGLELDRALIDGDMARRQLGHRRGGGGEKQLDREASRAMVDHINTLRKANESIGGVFEVIAFGVVPGLGSHVSWEERLDGRLAGAVCSIQACKGVAFGDGFDVAGRPGSEAHDEIFYEPERGFYRETNRAGGLEGGMTTGEALVMRAA